MIETLPLTLTSRGQTLDVSESSFGWLSPSSSEESDAALRQRLEEDGYLFLPGYLDVGLVASARDRLLEQLHERGGFLSPDHPLEEGVASPSWVPQSCHRLAAENEPLRELLYRGRMIDLYGRLLSGLVRHFDFTWIRVIGPGPGTAPHADAVYMNRGTSRLYTSWTPLMEIPLEMGGLMVMPGSHRIDRLRKYFDADVDIYCTNRPNRPPQDVHGWIGPAGDGKLSNRPASLQKRLGLIWRTAETWHPGDVIVFSIRTLHGSLDNHSDRLRLSTDSRYQRADEPADPRWIGERPIGHGPAAREGRIC